MYVTGYFSSATASFGSVSLTNAGTDGGSDVFVAKLTDTGSTGSFAWAQRAGGTGGDYALALAANGTSVYVAGAFGSATASFGPVTLTNAASTADVFIAKLTDAGSTGSFVWAQRAGGTGDEEATTLAVSGTHVYVGRYFYSPTASFGPATLTNAGTGTQSSADVFIAKLTDGGSTGSFGWAQQAGGTGNDYASALAVSGANVYVDGSFNSPTAGFGSTTLTLTSASTALSSDVFVAKLTDAGNTGSFAWAQRAGGTRDDYATALAVSGPSVYVTGYFSGTAAGFGTTTLTNAGTSDIFIAKLTDAGSVGSFAWAQQAGGARNDGATALAVSGTSVYVAGYIGYLTADFGAITLANPNPNSSLGYLATLTDLTLTPTTPGRTLTPAQLYPNPARHAATLRLPIGTAPAPLTLTDALGRAVRRYPAPVAAEATLDLRGLPAGLYLLRGAGPAQRLAVE